MATLAPAVELSGLTKSYGRTRALDGLELTVRTGEVHGFLGPNGAGKSTAIRVLLGMLRADAGTVRLLDGDPWRDAARLHRRLAYVPGDVALWPHLTGGEAIGLLSRLRGPAAARAARGRIAELLERFDLDPTKRGRTYSKGNRQKVALVAAFASPAELLLLDEPTSGLDPLMEAVFQQLVAEARQEGRTVLLSSHLLAQVEKVCDRVSIVRRGRTVGSGTLDELRRLTRTEIDAETAHPPLGLEQLPGVHDLLRDGAHVRFSVEGADLDAALHRLAEAGVRGLSSRPPSLEELMLRYYGVGEGATDASADTELGAAVGGAESGEDEGRRPAAGRTSNDPEESGGSGPDAARGAAGESGLPGARSGAAPPDVPEDVATSDLPMSDDARSPGPVQQDSSSGAAEGGRS